MTVSISIRSSEPGVSHSWPHRPRFTRPPGTTTWAARSSGSGRCGSRTSGPPPFSALGSLAHDRYARPRLVRLLASPVETKKLLGLPADVQACVFNVDGVLVASAELHAEVWKELFNRFIASRIERSGVPFATFSRRVDYPTLVHGRSRPDAVRAFLASRGISLAEGLPDDPPDSETVHGLANRKKQTAADSPRAERCQRLRRRAPLSRARTRCAAALRRRLRQHQHAPAAATGAPQRPHRRVHRREPGLERRPATQACARHVPRRLPPPRRRPRAHRALRDVDGWGLAGRAGHFELVVAVEQDGNAASLRSHGADRVVTDLGEILEQALAWDASGGRTARARERLDVS